MVDRDRKDSRKETIEKIKERTRQLLAAKDTPDAFAWSQIAIFAEGTTTNRTSLITFKPGIEMCFFFDASSIKIESYLFLFIQGHFIHNYQCNQCV